MPKPPHSPKIDKRLLDTWKSDARRTFAEWNWKRNTTATKRARFKSFFGKLEITYTRNRIISKFPQQQWEQSQRYAVLGTDKNSVAIVIFGKLKIKNRKRYDPLNLAILEDCHLSDARIEHVHFGDGCYWVSIGNGRNREFFRRIKKHAFRTLCAQGGT